MLRGVSRGRGSFLVVLAADPDAGPEADPLHSSTRITFPSGEDANILTCPLSGFRVVLVVHEQRYLVGVNLEEGIGRATVPTPPLFATITLTTTHTDPATCGIATERFESGGEAGEGLILDERGSGGCGMVRGSLRQKRDPVDLKFNSYTHVGQTTYVCPKSISLVLLEVLPKSNESCKAECDPDS
ncbi:hypothetical protein BDP27DRAFT_1370688 [Rhodocollybia butyracea]|uniref:Uncharacterized protein n=1 Tax=Rhodocollybia butyracea TaxID=206335 RepID=A0A9P5P8L1_9AGAR|nr:hypothetical protein BDP27DRAFT_1370688 [Rhodocollybia butyracea]